MRITTKRRKLRSAIKRREFCVCVYDFTFRKSFRAFLPLQRLQAAVVLIDGLHLRIFVPRRRVSRIVVKKIGFTFSGNTGNLDGCLPPACIEWRWRWCSTSDPLLVLSLNAPLFHLPWTYRQHWESFASCTPTVRKLNERLQLCSQRCNEQSCLFYKFIIGVALRRITELPHSLAVFHPRRHPAHATLL